MRGKEGGCRGQSTCSGSSCQAAEMTVGYRPSGLCALMAATIECSGGPHHRVRSSSRCPDMATRASDYLASIWGWTGQSRNRLLGVIGSFVAEHLVVVVSSR